MEKLTERIGVFDLWAIFFPGAVGILELLFFGGTFWCLYSKQPIYEVFRKITAVDITIWIIVIGIIISLFLGIILQEIGRWIRGRAKTSNATDVFLDPKSGIFRDNEIAFLHNSLIHYGWDGKSQNDSKIIFHRINVKAQECGISEKYVKLSVLQNMAVSLSAAMLMGTILSTMLLVFSVLCGRGHISFFLATVDLLCVFFIVLFFRRAKRFNRYWVRNLIYSMAEKCESAKESEA